MQLKELSMQAIWNDQVIADSENTVIVDNNHYFPADSIVERYFEPSTTTTVCSWKGKAHYYSLAVNGETNVDAAWFYPNSQQAAKHIEGYIAFWKGVDIRE
jgi:uncharacterized protein (DUF427 family)